MKQTTLIEYLQSNLSSEQFQKEIEVEVNSYLKTRDKSSSAIIVDKRNNFSHELTSNEIATLLRKYLSGEINALQLEYILNYIEFAAFNIDEKLCEHLLELSTPELFGPISQQKVEDVLERITL